MKKIWKVTFGLNVDSVRVRAATIEDAIVIATKYATDALVDYLPDDRAITEVAMIMEGWLEESE